jgi:hypothetical protein
MPFGRSTGAVPSRWQQGDRAQESEHPARAPRTRTCLSGKIVYGDGVYTADCAIRDISECGAKIVLSRHQSLPSDVYLIIVKYCVAHRATAMWAKFHARGLKFSQTYKLDGELPRELKFLRRLWDDLSARSGVEPDRTPKEAYH